MKNRNKQKNKESSAKWYRKNAEKLKAASIVFYKENRELHKKRIKGSHLKKFWPNLSGKEALIKYEELRLKQSNKCAICKNEETVVRNNKIKDLCVDHCHISNKVRGLLCDRCNRAIGLFKDNPDTCFNANLYLRTI